ncbi:MAG: hypothetical protein B6D64_08940 [Bacteroidetes bacterium 4484_276]|nr:MAG: hypothetical protein B6D64_08940 [Bacteroidetes bacterium 4484_276]
MARERTDSYEEIKEQQGLGHELTLFNDEINSFDFVIDTLVEVCGHDPISAEQCTLVAHYNGKCVVREGGSDELEPIGKEMTDRGLSISIS